MSLVLGLGLEHSCPWPRECLSSERLSLALASDFFCVLGLGVGLEPCVLDSTSGAQLSTIALGFDSHLGCDCVEWKNTEYRCSTQERGRLCMEPSFLLQNLALQLGLGQRC